MFSFSLITVSFLLMISVVLASINQVRRSVSLITTLLPVGRGEVDCYGTEDGEKH